MSVISLLSSDGYIIVNKALIKGIGLTEAVMLGELCSEYGYFDKMGTLVNGWFYSMIENVEKNISLSPYQQRVAIQRLVNLGIIEVDIKGMPATRYVKIDGKYCKVCESVLTCW